MGGDARRLTRSARRALRSSRASACGVGTCIGTSIWHSPQSHVRFPFSDLRGTGTRARTRGSAVAARRLSRALCAAARTLRSSRASACGVGTCILAPALANATVRSARGRRARDGSLVGRTQAPERSGGDGAARVTMLRRMSGCTGTARHRRPLCVSPSSTGAAGGCVESVARAAVGKSEGARVADLQVRVCSVVLTFEIGVTAHDSVSFTNSIHVPPTVTEGLYVRTQTLQQLHHCLATWSKFNVAQAITMHSICQAAGNLELLSTLIHDALAREVTRVLS